MDDSNLRQVLSDITNTLQGADFGSKYSVDSLGLSPNCFGDFESIAKASLPQPSMIPQEPMYGALKVMYQNTIKLITQIPSSMAELKLMISHLFSPPPFTILAADGSGDLISITQIKDLTQVQ